MLAGEASDFERAELADELAADEELASFAREAGRVHALLTAVHAWGETGTWRLAEPRRSALLKRLAETDKRRF